MKYTNTIIMLCVLLSSIFSSCKLTPEKTNKEVFKEQSVGIKVNTETKYAKIKFIKETHRFGNVIEGEVLECIFYYENTGNKNLIVKNVEVSCGCTNVRWDKKPLKVGGKAKIVVSFDSHGRHGKQYKTISVFSNSLESIETLVLTAVVE